MKGRIVIKDPRLQETEFSNMWVGLAAASEPGQKDLDWQYEGKSYQFWVKADENGNFSIPNVRAGKYNLYSFADGILGEYKKTGISVAAGDVLDLSELPFVPQRFGRQVWEIGIPNRSASEFKHGDHYWQWGLYMLYPKEFPDDVNYTIGTSDWSKDWNYCQPGVIDGNYKVIRGTTWKINFEVPEQLKGKATLRLAFCGSRKDEKVQVALNGKTIGIAGPLPTMGVMHRDGIPGETGGSKHSL